MPARNGTNAFAAKAKAAEDAKRDMDAMVDTPAEKEPSESKTKSPKTGKTNKKSVSAKGSKGAGTKKSSFSGELVAANFKIPSDARKKLKMYAVSHDTTTVAVLLDMIAALPEP